MCSLCPPFKYLMNQISSEIPLILKVPNFRFFNFRLAFPSQFWVILLLLSRVSFRTRIEASQRSHATFILEKN